MTVVLDAGAFLAVERGDRDLVALLQREVQRRQDLLTHGGVVGQVWRGGRRQARLARLLRAVKVVPLDQDLGRRAGALLGRAHESDVIDAAVVLLAADGEPLPARAHAADVRADAHRLGHQAARMAQEGPGGGGAVAGRAAGDGLGVPRALSPRACT